MLRIMYSYVVDLLGYILISFIWCGVILALFDCL